MKGFHLTGFPKGFKFQVKMQWQVKQIPERNHI